MEESIASLVESVSNIETAVTVLAVFAVMGLLAFVLGTLMEYAFKSGKAEGKRDNDE